MDYPNKQKIITYACLILGGTGWVTFGVSYMLTFSTGVVNWDGPCTYRYFHFSFSMKSEKWKMNNNFSFFIFDEK